MINTYVFYGKQTTIWYSTKTGRKMTPGTKSVKYIVQSGSFEEAFKAIFECADNSVTKDQKRDVSLYGNVRKMSHSNQSSLGRIEEIKNYTI